jgi:hypothetical protein
LLFIQDCVGSHGECAERFDFYRRGMETEACIGKTFERTHMLADGDAIAQQDCVGGTRAIGYVVNVVGIDPHESRARINQELRGFLVRMGVPQILIRANAVPIYG